MWCACCGELDAAAAATAAAALFRLARSEADKFLPASTDVGVIIVGELGVADSIADASWALPAAMCFLNIILRGQPRFKPCNCSPLRRKRLQGPYAADGDDIPVGVPRPPNGPPLEECCRWLWPMGERGILAAAATRLLMGVIGEYTGDPG